MIKRLWEKIDGRVMLIIGWVLGLATWGVLLWAKEWVAGRPVLKILFGWLSK